MSTTLTIRPVTPAELPTINCLIDRAVQPQGYDSLLVKAQTGA
jgi:hypothetical protein